MVPVQTFAHRISHLSYRAFHLPSASASRSPRPGVAYLHHRVGYARAAQRAESLPSPTPSACSTRPPSVVPFARRIVETAPDRVIWGTDWPHPNVKQMPNDGDLVDFVPLFLPEAELQRRILVENPARLFEFEA